MLTLDMIEERVEGFPKFFKTRDDVPFVMFSSRIGEPSRIFWVRANRSLDQISDEYWETSPSFQEGMERISENEACRIADCDERDRLERLLERLEANS